MEFQILHQNLTNPTLLFFILGMTAVWLKSNLKIPESSSKFISLYLLFAIGFKGGQELAHSGFSSEVINALLFGLALATIIPLYTFYLLRQKLSTSDAAAVASSYGSVSAVTFVAALAFLESQKLASGGHMVAVMALMESPAIIAGVILLKRHERAKGIEGGSDLRSAIQHSFTNESVLLLLGSLLIGLVANDRQAQHIRPFTNDLFNGFLVIFLLEMGMVTARRFSAFRQFSFFVSAFAILVPAVNGCTVAYISQFVTADPGNRFLFAVLAASASYIAVPAAMRLAAPKADPGLYIPMALGITFPFNITIGMPVYFLIIRATGY